MLEAFRASNFLALFQSQGQAAAVTEWMQGLGELSVLQEAAHDGQTRLEMDERPRLEPIQPRAHVSLRASEPVIGLPFGYTPLFGGGSGLMASMDMFLEPSRVGECRNLLEALRYVTQEIAQEHAITVRNGAYAVYRGDTNSVLSSPFEELFLHTHCDGIALPSLADLRNFFARAERNPSYSTLIYGQPADTHEVSFIKSVDRRLAGIWHWRDHKDPISGRHRLSSRRFLVHTSEREGDFPIIEAEEQLIGGGVAASRTYDVRRDYGTVGSEQDFWKMMLGI